MQFSTRSEYGLRALVRLAKNKNKEPYSLAKIAEEEKLSLAYLERLFASLKKVNIVKSTKGVSGGYLLARPAKQISLMEILKALEGNLLIYRCLGSKGDCLHKNCQTKLVWHKIQKVFIDTLGKMKLADLV